MKYCRLLFFWIFWGLTMSLYAQTEVTTTASYLESFLVEASGDQVKISSAGANGPRKVKVNGEEQTLDFKNGEAFLGQRFNRKGSLVFIQTDGDAQKLVHVSQRRNGSLRLRTIPLWMSLLPPLIAIILALIFREVVISLFTGIWVGAFIAGGMRLDSIHYFFLSIFSVVEKYVIQALNDGGHLSIIVFSILIGGIVGLISRNGGMAGVVQSLSKYARSPRSAQFITWLLGVAIFFDDYANTLIVGNTMRSVTDRFNISREKLAYIVDSTAAPVAAIAFITTWIGAELGYIDDGIKILQNFDHPSTPYAIFISSLKYSFYPVLTLCFILMLIYTGRDYGGMLKAERRARTTGQVSAPMSLEDHVEEVEDLSPVPNAILDWKNAVIPIGAVILLTIYGLIDTGMSSTYAALLDANVQVGSESWGATWRAMPALIEGQSSGFFRKLGLLIGNSDSYVALLWSSLTGAIIALVMTISRRIMNVNDAVSTMVTGFKTMIPALLILTLAWSLAATTEELHTATYLTTALRNSLNPYLVPVLVFILAAGIAFSTGSSWSTMAILYPIAIPTTWAICQANGMESDLSYEILLNVIAVVLAASVLGDHCSPISDTTILSSLASDCNHIDHVRTQLPYALTVGAVSIVAGGLSTLLGGGWLISFILLVVSLVVLYVIVLRVGKVVEE